MVTNDTKMCSQCKSDGEKCKCNSILTTAWLPPQYAKGKVLQFRLGTSVTQTRTPPARTKKASKMTVLSDCENIFQKIDIRPILNKLKLDC